ncbi:MAG: hypothetical protein IPM82_11915 [Saprospiraceae bacterium]|nr:hypothetical protein [Saprospiraceae bacterium]
MKTQISDFESSLRKIEAQLKLLENQFAPTASKARDNAGPILQVTEMVTNLMYCLRSNDPKQQWLTRPQLDTMLDGGRRQAIFLGLMQQRLASTKGVGPISASGLADLVQLTIKDIQLLPRLHRRKGHNGLLSEIRFRHTHP